MVVLGINAGPDPIEDLEVFVDAFQISFPVLLDTSGITYAYRQTGAISPFPLDYVIDPEGNVAYFSTEYDPATIVTVVDSLLATGTPVEDTPAADLRPLLSAAPNPFNPQTQVRFDLPVGAEVTLDVHDARGRRLRRLIDNRPHAAGAHALEFDGRDDRGRAMPSGTYLLRLRAGRDAVSHKLTLVR